MWENALVELTFRHMVAAASAGGLWAAAGALADARTPQLLPVVGGIGAGMQAVLLVSLLWLTREGQLARRLNRPPADVLQGKVVMRFLPLAVGLVVALLWLSLLG